jgi:cytochrome c
MSKCRKRVVLAAAAAAAVLAIADGAWAQGKKFGIGRTASQTEIAGWDIDVRPDGQGLPVGKGTAKQGEPLYVERCAACHGEFGESTGRWPLLAGGIGTLKSHDPQKSIGSYWPFAATVIDYIRRSMPFGNSQSLANDELYAIVAYVLMLNDVITDENFELNQTTFKNLKMPNEANFIDDDRETAEKAFWKKDPCMKDCLPGKAEIAGRARVLDVTPEPGKGPKVD